MRPSCLYYVFSSTTCIRGVGEGIESALRRLLDRDAARTPVVRDLLFHLPVSTIDRRMNPPLYQVQDGSIITTVIKVEEHFPPSARHRGSFSRRPYKVVCSNKTGSLILLFFNPKGDYIAKSLPSGAERVVSGKVERFDGIAHITHPDRIAPAADFPKIARVEPVYPLTYALTNRMLTTVIQNALYKLEELPEWIDGPLRASRGWKSWRDTILAVHQPQTEAALLPDSPDRARLAYDELLAGQLALAIIRGRIRKQKADIIPQSPSLKAQLALPFTLTGSQQVVLGEIESDMASGSRMLRLLQGDVGSGKTAVALLAMTNAVAAGKQAAILAPTEILAIQHRAFIEKHANAAGMRVAFLSSAVKGKKRQEILDALTAGDIDMLIGTHAIFQEDVIFKDLALAVIDEQHRFGVAQRLALSEKGTAAHILLMTATPIPRSLAMTAFGDMDVSLLTEKPAGRQPVITRTVPHSRKPEVVEGIRRAVARGKRVFWICPLIEEAQDEEPVAKKELAAAEVRYAEFQTLWGDRVGLLHGRMKPEARDAVMKDFASGALDVLVATTIVEVGVHVPEATIMVIEQAERFGLSQLHQLRGRVGRGEGESSCILLYADRPGEMAVARLKMMRETEDGFIIAEEDLRLRGAGEVLGTRQSGLPPFRFVDLAIHADLIAIAKDDVKYILHTDPELTSERGRALRTLLYLFEYDANIRYLGSG